MTECLDGVHEMTPWVVKTLTPLTLYKYCLFLGCDYKEERVLDGDDSKT